MGIPYIDTTKIVAQIEESAINEDIEDVPNDKNTLSKMMIQKETVIHEDMDVQNNKVTPPKVQEKQSADLSEPPTKKRVQLVTLSSPKNSKNKKYLNN